MEGSELEVVMELNCKDKTMRYIANGKDYGIAFEKVDSTQNYHFGVSVYNNCIIQLSNFQTKQC